LLYPHSALCVGAACLLRLVGAGAWGPAGATAGSAAIPLNQSEVTEPHFRPLHTASSTHLINRVIPPTAKLCRLPLA
jgi:hypothetical protein